MVDISNAIKLLEDEKENLVGSLNKATTAEEVTSILLSIQEKDNQLSQLNQIITENTEPIEVTESNVVNYVIPINENGEPGEPELAENP